MAGGVSGRGGSDVCRVVTGGGLGVSGCELLLVLVGCVCEGCVGVGVGVGVVVV